MRSSRKLGCSSGVAILATSACLCAPALGQSSHASAGFFPGGTVSGVIVDAEGIPQMGALVQLLLPDTTPAATALTDSNGRYRVTDVRPGSYRVRVSAALFLPAMRQTLRIGLGTRAVVNLTLSTLLAPTQWLPATRRSSDAADDDWIWALRSSTIRPVLRLATDDKISDAMVGISTSSREQRSVQARGRIALYANDGGFAHGGNHQVLSLEAAEKNGTVRTLRADFSGPRVPYPVAPSAEVSAGFGRQMPLGTTTRTVLTWFSHPELLNATGANGMQAAVLRNAQRIELGDMIRVDAGSVAVAYNLQGNSVGIEPFIRLAYRPADGVVIAYSFTEARGTSQLEDLDQVQTSAPMAVRSGGKLQLSRGRSSSISLALRTPHGGRAEIAAYREKVVTPLIGGTGLLPATDAASLPVSSDPTTQTFAMAGRDFDGGGFRISAEQPLTAALAVAGSVSSGTALGLDPTQTQSPIHVSQLRTAAANAVSASVRARLHVAKSGTRAEAGYRWQRASTLTAVDSYRALPDPAFLNVLLRQRLDRVPLMPNGFEAVLQLQNLLAEGYRPLITADGKTVYLAQAPRMIQAGLTFTF